MKLLTEGDDWRGAVRLVAINATLRRECEAVAPLLAAANRPGTADELLVLLIGQAPTFGITGRNRAEWATLFGIYLDALATLPAECVADAFLRWNRGEMYPNDPGRHAFYPKPAELFTFGNAARIALGNAAWRAKKAMEWVEANAPQKSVEERAAVRADLIAKGWMTEDGKMVLGKPGEGLARRVPYGGPASRETPQQMAERLRRAGDDGEAV